MDDPDMGIWAYDYDALSNLKIQTDTRGCTLTLEYDDLNRLDTKTSSGTYCGQQVSVDYDYDEGINGIGRRTSMEDDSGSTEWVYDERGRLKNESKTINGHSAFITEWTYNSADLPSTMTYPDEEVVTYEYNDRMLLEYVSGADTYVYNLDYDSAGRMITRELGNSLTQTFGYYDWDEHVNNVGQGGRLETLATESLQNLSYVYDSIGNVSQITNSLANETSTYEYDSLNRLTSWTLNNQTESYGYDGEGNLASKAGEDLYYNDTNHFHAVTDAYGNSYEYDANGNQTVREINSDLYELSYDAENSLVEVKKNDTTIAIFTFDGDGRRVKSTVNGETILFVGAYFELNTTTNQATKYYLAGDRIAMRKYVIPQTMSVEYTLGDHLGSTSMTTDTLGNMVSELRYTSWGEVRYSWTDPFLITTPNYEFTKYTFTGQYSYMEVFELMFYNARFYDPAIGRFASADTFAPGGVQGYDRYAYVNNSPLMFTDPTGHKCVPTGVGDCAEDDGTAGPGFAPEPPSCYQQPSSDAISAASSYVPATDDEKLSQPQIHDYAAMGFGVQTSMGAVANDPEQIGASLGSLLYYLLKGQYDGLGLASVSDAQMKAGYGQKVVDISGNVRGYGLGLAGFNQLDPVIASRAMARRIEQVLDVCQGCSATDLFIAAALASNSGFYKDSMKSLLNQGIQSNGLLNWDGYLNTAHYEEVNRGVIQQAINNSWWLETHGKASYPGVDWEKACSIATGK